MAISQTKPPHITTPEAVYDQPPAPRPNGVNSGRNGLSAGAITGLAVGGVVACALSFVVGMQVGGSQNGGINSQAGGPPGMSRSQNRQPGGPGSGQNQTGQNSQTPAAKNNDGTVQNSQTTPSGQTDSAQPSTTNTAPQTN